MSCMVEARDYRLEVLLSSYHNPSNQRGDTGTCCDEGSAPCHPHYINCSKCDPVFTITTTGSDLSYTTQVYSNRDLIYFPGNIYLFYGNDSVWMGNGISVNVLVEDEAGGGNQPIKEFSFLINALDMQEDCTFHSDSIKFADSSILCVGFIELNISYWITQTTGYCMDTANCNDEVGTNPVTEFPAPTSTTIVTSSVFVTTTIEVPQNCSSAAPSLLPHATPKNSGPIMSSLASARPTDEPSCPPDRGGGGGIASGVCGASTVGGFLLGLLLAVTLCVCVVVYLRQRARKRSKLPYCLPRREHNPFYQSAEDLTDKGVPTWKQLQEYQYDNSGYETLRALPDSENNPFYQSAEDLTDRGVPTWKQLQECQDDNSGYETLRALADSENKALPLSKKEKGFLYCLSPTDPPVPLRPVPSPRRSLLQPTPTPQRGETPTRGRQPGRVGHRKRPNNLASGLAPDLHTQHKDSPIYEMPDNFINPGPRREQPPRGTNLPPPPTLPVREHLTRGRESHTSTEPQLPPQNPQIQNPRDPELPCTVLGDNSSDGREPEELVVYGEEREDGGEIGLKEFGGVGEGENGAITTTPHDISPLYANVKKVPKVESVSGSDPQPKRKESTASERPPGVPPYSGESWLEGEQATTDDKVEDKDSECLPCTPCID